MFCASLRREAGRLSPVSQAARWRVVTGPPCSPEFPRKVKGLTGYWAVLFQRALGQDPAGPSPAHPSAFEVAAFQHPEILSTGLSAISGLLPTAHWLACLRINRLVTGTAARLATDLLVRLWSGGACTHRTTILNFMYPSTHSFQTSRACSLPGFCSRLWLLPVAPAVCDSASSAR